MSQEQPGSQPTHPPQPPRPSSTGSAGGPDRRALIQAYQDLVKSESERKRHEFEDIPAAPRRHTFSLLMLALSLAILAILVIQPAWLFTPPLAESREYQEAGLRVGMYREIQRIEEYRQATGRLPASLTEASGDTTGLTYVVQGQDYSLTGRSGGIEITYSSAMPAGEFVGRSYDLIRGRNEP